MSMKNSVFVILLFFVCDFAYSQNYQPFPLTNAAWKEFHKKIYGSSNADITRIQHETSADTLINGEVYTKIVRTGSLHNPQTGTIYYNNEYVGAIREDSSKRVFFIPEFYSAEQLLYDFNINSGDTLPVMYGMQAGVYYIVESIDSVLVLGTYHKRYNIKTDGTPELRWFYIIEGIGSTVGLLTKTDFDHSMYESDLICFKRNGQDAYPDGAECELYEPQPVDEPDPTDDQEKNKTKIYPNPTKGIVIVDCEKSIINSTAKITDAMGQIVSSYDITNTNTFTITIDGASGFYFLELIPDSGGRSVYKIIKE